MGGGLYLLLYGEKVRSGNTVRMRGAVVLCQAGLSVWRETSCR